jgi:SET domain-containing protein
MTEPALKRKLADVSVGESKIHGQGVFARKTFSKGDLVLEIDDSDPVLDRGALTPEQEIFIDVFIAADGTQKTTWMKSPERFINHSCEPNTYVQTDMTGGVRRTLALKNIRAGDELTWDYALNIWEEWVGPVPCNCGAERCRRMIRGNFFTLPREVQRRYLPLLDEPFKKRFAREIHSRNFTIEHDSA